MVRVVVDTNVLVSALIGHGKPRRLVLRLVKKRAIVLSKDILSELTGVLSREKFREIERSQVKRFLFALVEASRLVTSPSIFRVIAEDPDDDLVLNTAHAGHADYIVTGDKHLLALKEFKRLRIVKVSQMSKSSDSI